MEVLIERVVNENLELKNQLLKMQSVEEEVTDLTENRIIDFGSKFEITRELLDNIDLQFKDFKREVNSYKKKNQVL